MASITSKKPPKKWQFWSLSSLSALYICWCDVQTLMLHHACYIQGVVSKKTHCIKSKHIKHQEGKTRDNHIKISFQERCFFKRCEVWRIENQQVKGRLESAIPELCTDPAARRHCSLTSHVRRHGLCALFFLQCTPASLSCAICFNPS